VLLNVEVEDCSGSPFLRIRNGLYSADYGQIQQTNIVELFIEQKCPIVFSTQLKGRRIA